MNENFVANKLKKWLPPLKESETVFHLVGGAVRDYQMGRPIMDLDLVCKNAKEAAGQIASIKNASVVDFHKKPEEPCYRLVNRLDQNDHIDIAELKGGTISEDLAHRDFTINAMALPVSPEGQTGRVIDPFGGIIDIEQKRIRIVQSDVFEKDPLRMLRAVRFSAELGFRVTTDTLELIHLKADKISQVAGERIWSELKRILQHENSTAFIHLMDRLQVLTGLFPEIEAMKVCPQNAHHHLDVWPHSVLVLRHCEKMINTPGRYFGEGSKTVKDHFAGDHRSALLKLAALLHDVGKPATRGIDTATGRITFFGHDQIGAEIVAKIAHRLSLSNAERNYLTVMVAEHLHILSLVRPDVKPSTRLRLFRVLKDDSISLIIHGMADILSTRGPASNRAYRREYVAWAQTTIAAFNRSTRPLIEPDNDLLRGRDLINLGMPPGPDMGTLLARIRQAQDDGLVQDRAGALALAQKISRLP